MALITFRFPTTPQSITHFLETTILFSKQSNCSQSKSNLVIKVRGIFKYQRTCVWNSFPFKLLDKLLLAFKPETIMRMFNWIILVRQWMRSSLGDKDFLKDFAFKTEFLFTVPQVAHKATQRSGKWRANRWYPLEGSEKFKSTPSNCSTFFGGIRLPTLPPSSYTHRSPGPNNSMTVNWEWQGATLSYKETRATVSALGELPI